MISSEFLKYFGIDDEEDEKEEDISNIELVEMEIGAVIEELAVKHADTEEYTTSVGNLKTLSETLGNLAKAENDMSSAGKDGPVKERVKWDVIIPKVATILMYGAGTAFIVLIEREHPVPMRLVQFTNSLLSPRS